jgi:hypothetical protein
VSGGPVGVQLHRADGTVLNCELADEGVTAEGLHHWVIANAVYRLGDKITCEVLPGRTSIGFHTDFPADTVRVSRHPEED